MSRTLLKTVLAIGMIMSVILYPFMLRDLIFDNIPRDWTLSSFKSIILVLIVFIDILSVYFFLYRPSRGWELKLDHKFFIKMLTPFTLLLPIFFPFWQFYSSDRAWISADFFSRTGHEIEMCTIGEVMRENQILGFHYRALFLKMFHFTFFPFGIIFPILLLALGEFIDKRNLIPSLITILLLLLVFLCFGMLLYG